MHYKGISLSVFFVSMFSVICVCYRLAFIREGFKPSLYNYMSFFWDGCKVKKAGIIQTNEFPIPWLFSNIMITFLTVDIPILSLKNRGSISLYRYKSRNHCWRRFESFALVTTLISNLLMWLIFGLCSYESILLMNAKDIEYLVLLLLPIVVETLTIQQISITASLFSAPIFIYLAQIMFLSTCVYSDSPMAFGGISMIQRSHIASDNVTTMAIVRLLISLIPACIAYVLSLLIGKLRFKKYDIL